MEVVLKIGKICDKIKCSECVNGYTIKTAKGEKFGCKVLDAIIAVPKLADAIDRFSRMDFKTMADSAMKMAGEFLGGKKDEGEDKAEKPT